MKPRSYRKKVIELVQKGCNTTDIADEVGCTNVYVETDKRD
jgi:hypothetical protein